MPRCECGRDMKWMAHNESWACPRTLDAEGVPRPKTGHDFFVDPDDPSKRESTSEEEALWKP